MGENTVLYCKIMLTTINTIKFSCYIFNKIVCFVTKKYQRCFLAKFFTKMQATIAKF